VHVLSVSSLKGGVGKTTVALGLASAAFARGMRTLVVDLDPQCDATTGLGALGLFRETITDVLQTPKHNIVHRAIVASPWGEVRSGKIDVMVGSRTVSIFDTPQPKLRDIWKLEEALSKVESDYDIVIIDTPPSLNGLTRTAWVCSDRVLLVSEPSIYAVTATDRAFKAIEEIRRKLNTRLDHAGIVINRYQPENREHEFRVQELDKLFGERLFTTKIPERATVQQAQGAARPIHSWPGESAAEMSQIFDSVLNRIEESFKSDSRRTRKQESKDHKANLVMRGQSLDQVLGFEAAD
jgi:cellulose biosynthesis protein BcsQ